MQKVVDTLELDNCALHPEFKINERGIFLLEIGPRLGGDYITSHLVPLSTGIDIEKLLIQIATRTTVEIGEKENKASIIKYFEFPENYFANDLNIERYYSEYPELVLIESISQKGDVIKKDI